jgi:predicted TIM-barrel fold metal-dependent hydrolase
MPPLRLAGESYEAGDVCRRTEHFHAATFRAARLPDVRHHGTVIVDAHAYCFEPVGARSGYSTAEERLRWLQISHALHHQPAWRVRDRAPSDSTVLLDPTPDDPWRLRTDLDFRPDAARSRMVWTVDGEDVTKTIFPPHLVGLGFDPDQLIAEMDAADIDVALLHTDPSLGRDHAYQAACIRAYPDRLRSMASVDEWRLLDDLDTVIRETIDAIEVHGLHGIKFHPGLFHGSHGWHGQAWEDGPLRPFWEAVTGLRVPVFLTLDGAPGVDDERQAYLAELGAVGRWLDRYPEARCGLTHGFPYRAFRDGDGLHLPGAIWNVFSHPNLYLEVSFPVRIGDWWEYPWRETWPILAAMAERIGPDRLMWGTDVPFQGRFCTYRQSRDYLERHCRDLLGEEGLGRLLGGSAARLLGLPSEP